MLTVEDRRAAISTRLAAAESELRDGIEIAVDCGLDYAEHDPVIIWVRRRDHRYDIHDDGGAVARAGKPAGWLAEGERLVAQHGFNINRRGVVWVPAVEGRDIAGLASRLAETSRAVYLTLLES